MLAVNAPKKLVARIQVLVSLALAAICLVLSLTSPLARIDFKDAATLNSVNDMLVKMNVDLGIDEIPDHIDVSAVKMYGVVGTLINVVGAAKDTAAAAQQGTADTSKLKDSIYESDGKTLKEGAKNSLLLAAAIASSLTSDMKDAKGFGGIVGVVIPLFATIALLVFSMIAPIYFLIAFLVILINTLKNLQNPEDAVAKVVRRLPKTLYVPVSIMLFACVTKALSPGSGAMTLFILVLISALINVVATRMHAWDKKPLRLANVIQGLSLVSIVGFIVFLFNIIHTGVFNTLFTNSSFLVAASKGAAAAATKAVTSNSVAQAAANSVIESNQKFLPDLLLVLVAVGIVLASYSYLTAVLTRITLSEKPNKKGVHIVFAVFLMLAAILPMVVQGFKHDTSVNPAISYLAAMTDKQNSALSGALVGAIIIFVSELAIIILPKVLCSDMTPQEVSEVLSNNTTTEAEKVQKAKEILAKAEERELAEAKAILAKAEKAEAPAAEAEETEKE